MTDERNWDLPCNSLLVAQNNLDLRTRKQKSKKRARSGALANWIGNAALIFLCWGVGSEPSFTFGIVEGSNYPTSQIKSPLLSKDLTNNQTKLQETQDITHQSTQKTSWTLGSIVSRAFASYSSLNAGYSSVDSEHDFLQYANYDNQTPENQDNDTPSEQRDHEAVNFTQVKPRALVSSHLGTTGGGSVIAKPKPKLTPPDFQTRNVMNPLDKQNRAHQESPVKPEFLLDEEISSKNFLIESRKFVPAETVQQSSDTETEQSECLSDLSLGDHGSHSVASSKSSPQSESNTANTAALQRVKEYSTTNNVTSSSSLGQKSASAGNDAEESLFEQEESLLYHFNNDVTEEEEGMVSEVGYEGAYTFENEEENVKELELAEAEAEYPLTDEFTVEEEDSDWARLPKSVPYIIKQEDTALNQEDEAIDNANDFEEGLTSFKTTNVTKADQQMVEDRLLGNSIIRKDLNRASTTQQQRLPSKEFSDSDVEESEYDKNVEEEETSLWSLAMPIAKEAYTLGLHGARELIETYRQQKADGITNKPLRPIRKAISKVTGLSGFFSGKQLNGVDVDEDLVAVNEDELGIIQRRIAAIDMARRAVERRARTDEGKRRFGFGPSNINDSGEKIGPIKWLGARRRALLGPKIDEANVENVVSRQLTAKQGDILFREFPSVLDAVAQADAEARKAKSVLELAKERKRRVRIQEIDRQIRMGQELLIELQSERDDLLKSPNPLFNYTKIRDKDSDVVRTKRQLNFPPADLVDEYMEQLVSSGRLTMLNHTYLWKVAPSEEDYDEDDESIGDDLFTPSADARKLYEKKTRNGKDRKRSSGIGVSTGGGGSWLLRQSIGKGESLGEKIGSVMEMSTYKAVCKSIMAVLARSISALHGVNVMQHSDIRIYLEDSPDLPLHTDFGDGETYAQEAIKRVINRGASGKGKKKGKHKNRYSASYHGNENVDSFIQRDAVVETMLSHCQISAPLLKLFPLPWQRAFLSNIVTLVACVVSDFASGIRIQIMGHQLTFAFQPITEQDMMEQALLSMSHPPPFNNRKSRPQEFEAAVTAAANDLSEQLMFLDRWHERALGSGMLRAQLSNLIARVVLTLVDEVLTGTQMNMWTKQASGPRVIAGLEYRAPKR